MTSQPTPVRALLRTVLLGIAIGLGGVVGGTGLVRAADDAGVLDVLFSGMARALGLAQPAPRAEVAPRVGAKRTRPPQAATVARAGPRPAALRGPQTPRRTVAQVRAARVQTAALQVGDRTICVRTCDGYLFPLANRDGQHRASQDARQEVQHHEAACAAACPGAPTALLTLRAGQELDRAVSLSGIPYDRLPGAYLYRTRTVAGCSCRPGGALVAAALPISQDRTLRVGDAVATRRSAAVFTGPAFMDFRRAPNLSAEARRDLDRVLDVSRRERVLAVFRQTLRTARAEQRPIRVAAHSGFAVLATDASFPPVRVVVPSPFR
ncbi:DUF2865 domain-containing protein [Methylobacterium isbiliense]|jgi:hypothetical protein|uniref:DUF2865 domain-containing protein n=1 Tax=Methylobacterium isbiliense TaxID=315478 RepID=A0ABQ4SA85_9HYPH|nr:DUF2865 domain-containing protein [Methylobacterium isbiliense]MDN3623342.1 DUF2865 domain-containing protein [Methylobacterium isbiliense]GJE00102.1 hypothetical protein GMJLKIPL_2020 [Methylobacterium isbiliense]